MGLVSGRFGFEKTLNGYKAICCTIVNVYYTLGDNK